MEGIFDQFRTVYGMLGDEQSQDIYLNRVNWLISGNHKYIQNLASTCLTKLPDWIEMFEAMMKNMKTELPPDRNIVLYGAGAFAPTVLQYWKDDSRLIGFCSQTKSKQKTGYLGYPVMCPEELLSRKDLSVILSVDAEQPKSEIKQMLHEGGYPANQIYEIPRILYSAEKGQYFNPDFMKLGENEVFVDVGCLNLDTSLEFRQRCGSLKRVYAFEPEPHQFQICLARKKEELFPEAEVPPFGAWSERTTLHFSSADEGASCVCKSAGISISAIPIDEVVDPADKVTMIKMDIEGSELEALKGARKTIQRDKPRLAISIYHKPEDMTEIPLYIKELVPEYKLYIRHHSNSANETVLYAVMSE